MRTSSPPLPDADLWQTLARRPRTILLYGMGDGADKVISRLHACGLEAADVFAGEGFVRGQSFHGRRVLSLSEAEEKYGDFTVLVSFATRLPDVLKAIEAVAQRHELYVPDLPVCGEGVFDLPLCYANRDKMAAARALWADDRSRALFDSLIAARLGGSMQELLRVCDPTETYYSLLGAQSFRVAVDAGAYTGDTVAALLSAAPSVVQVFALEPDPKTCRRLTAYAQAEKRAEVCVHPVAAWREEALLPFARKANRGAGVSARTADSVVRGVAIDRLTEGEKVDFLKFDVEGAEAQALEGAKETIARCRPSILLSVYHRALDLFELPLALAALCPHYRFLLRRPRCIPAWETAVLAVPEERILS